MSMPKEALKQFRAAIRKADVERLKSLAAEHGIDSEISDRAGRQTLVTEAIAKGDHSALRLLLAAGADPGRGHAMNFATMRGDPEAVRLLLDAGVDPNGPECPLANAARHGHTETVSLLLSRGANVNHGRRPLAYAAEEGHADIVQMFLELGARPDEKGGLAGFTPLASAVCGATGGRLECVRLLLAAGADPNSLNNRKSATPLTFAAGNGNPAMIRALVAAGADVNVVTPLEGTSLFAAISEGRIGNVRTLLELGADPLRRLAEENTYYPNRQGKTPIEFAVACRRRPIVRLVERAIAGEPLSPPAPSNVGEAWERVVHALTESRRLGSTLLRRGVPDEAIDELGFRLGVELPDELRELFRLCDGQEREGDALVPDPEGDEDVGYALLSVENVYHDWKVLTDLLEREGADDETSRLRAEEGLRNIWWSPRWVPLASNGGGDFLFVDLDPDEGGQTGQVALRSHEEGPLRVLSPSITEWLGDLAESIQDA
jgi:ankyrin repeat protein/cell wall assembly regulator SMI1